MYGKWVPGMSGGLYCHQLAPRQRPRPWLAILTTQPWAPASHRVVQAIVTLSLWWKIKEWEWAKWKQTMHSSEKTENVLWSYDQESLEQALNSAAADCHRLLFVVNSVKWNLTVKSVKFHLTVSVSRLTYFIILLVDTHPVWLVNLLNPSFIIVDKRKLCKGITTFLLVNPFENNL